MVSVNTSSPLDAVRQYGANRINQLGSGGGSDSNSISHGVELPASAPLTFPTEAELFTEYKNGFHRTAHVAADYFDRRARASYVGFSAK